MMMLFLALATSAFVEPLATIAWVHTAINGFDIQGTGIKFEDSDSIRGSLGGRLGLSTYYAGGTKAELSVPGRVWYEFQDPGNISIASAGSVLNFADGIKGTFGEVTGTVNVFGLGTGWSGFVNGGVKFRDDWQVYNARAGVRYNWN